MTPRPGYRQETEETISQSRTRGTVEPRTRAGDGDGAGTEPISRILSSLDKLGARIRALSAEAATAAPSVPSMPAPAPLDLQRAVAEIARKRDAIEREASPVRPRTAAPADPQVASRVAPVADAPASLTEPDREPTPSRAARPESARAAAAPADRPRSKPREDRRSAAVAAEALSEIRGDLAALKAAVAETPSLEPLHALEKSYDALVSRLDDIRGAIESPRLLSDLIQRMAEVRRLLAGAPTEAQVQAIESRLDTLSERLEASLSGTGAPIAALESQFETLAKAIAGLDIQPLVDQVETRLRAVDEQVAAIMARIPGMEDVQRIMAAVERQSATLSSLTRQTETLPYLLEDIAVIKKEMRTNDASTQSTLQSLFAKLDEATEQVATLKADTERSLLDQVNGLVAEVAQRLDRLESLPGAEMLAALEQRFERFTLSLEGRLDQIDRTMGADLNEAIARIEQHLASDTSDDRFQRVEERLSEIAELLAEGSVASDDLAAIQREFAGLTRQISALEAPSLENVEAEIRALVQRIDALQRPSGDAAVLDQIDTKVADLLDRLEERGFDGSAIAEQMERIERALRLQPDQASLAAHAAQVAAETLAERDGREVLSAIAQLQRALTAMQSDLQAASQRDRDAVGAMNRTLEQLAEQLRTMPAAVAAELPRPAPVPAPERQPAMTNPSAMRPEEAPAAMPEAPRMAAAAPAMAAAAPAVTATAAPAETPAEGEKPAGGDSWSSLQRSLSDMLKRVKDEVPTRSAAPEAPRGPAADAAPQIRLDPVDVGSAAHRPAVDPADDEPLDLADDMPLEPGSGRPVFTNRPRSAPSGAPSRGEERPAAEPTKEDFIAAARRAAQAAAAEMEAAPKERQSRKAAKRPSRRPVAGNPPEGSETEAPAKASLIGSLFGRHKTRLMAAAAIVVLVTGTALGLKMILLPDVSPGPVIVETAPDPQEPAPVEDRIDVGTAESEPEVVASVEVPPAAASLPPVADATPPAAVSSPPVADLPPPPPAALPDAQSMAAEPLGPATTFRSASEEPVAAPPAADAIEMPPETVGTLALREAAAAGDGAAQFEVAARLTEGRGTPQDLKTAAIWYERAAAGGLPAAQYRIGSLYEKGQGVPRDPATAALWYSRAAEAGNAKAMHNLAVLHTDGSLGEPDFALAARWFTEAANLGVRDSQYNLGILYARGLGVERDLPSSYKWFAIAAEAGDQDAAKKRDDIAQSLDKDMLARARLAVETWKAGEPDPAANEVDTSNPAWTAQPEKAAAVGSVGAVNPILQAQQLLARRGYNPGPADGFAGQKTRDAIVAFQTYAGLAPTGIVDDALIRALSDPAL